ncbi:DUF2380 domain-containing protein [Povalibacter sp.]|uniref:DUF2380 domain-containing protein n=1 Tax=Povalibacter sp. TaxID=1962978 RepID=UPI002F4125B1
MKQRRAIAALSLALVVVLCPHAHAADNERDPVSIALIDLDYRDTSGEPTDQSEAHQARLRGFMDALRDDLARDGRFRIVDPKCDPAPCSIDQTDSQSLLDAAKAAGAKLLLYGGIHKASTLIQFADVLVADVDKDQVVVQRSLNFRGDDDRSWMRAEKFVARQLTEALANWSPE